MPQTEAEIRAAHPDWTDEQVQAEVTRQQALLPPPPEPPAPEPRQDPERDRAFAEMRRRLEQAERDAKTARDAVAERDRAEAERQGEWQKLAEQERAAREKAEAERATLQASIEADRARRNAERAATDLKFKDAGYALYLLEQDRTDLTDAATTAAALEALKTRRPDLLTIPPPPLPSGGPTGAPNGSPPGLTREQIAGMTPEAIAKLAPEVLNAALAAK